MTQEHPVDHPEQPPAHHVYGEVIYWLSIVAALICTIGPFISIAIPGNNVLDPHYLFYAIWQGHKPQQVWAEVSGGYPGAHFWIRNILKGDGLVQFGLVLGCASAGIAFLACGSSYLNPKRREIGWALLSFLSASIILFALLGVIRLGE